MLNELLRFGTIFRAQFSTVPFDFLADTVSNVAQQTSFRERPGVIKITGGRATGFAGFDPFVMMADGIRNLLWWRNEANEIFFRQ